MTCHLRKVFSRTWSFCSSECRSLKRRPSRLRCGWTPCAERRVIKEVNDQETDKGIGIITKWPKKWSHQRWSRRSRIGVRIKIIGQEPCWSSIGPSSCQTSPRCRTHQRAGHRCSQCHHRDCNEQEGIEKIWFGQPAYSLQERRGGRRRRGREQAGDLVVFGLLL